MKGWAVLLLTLIATAFANPIADANGDIFARGKKYPKGCRLTDYNCMLNYGGRPFVSTFCTSEVPITTVTKNRTTTETVYVLHSEMTLLPETDLEQDVIYRDSHGNHRDYCSRGVDGHHHRGVVCL